MRFFRYVIVFTLIFLVVIAGSFLAFQQWVLVRAYNQVIKDVSLLQRTKDVSEYYQYCQDLDAQKTNDSPLFTSQLRFISDTEYVLEIVCNQYEFVPKTITQRKLPLFATKKPGQSGLVLAKEGAWAINLQAVPSEVREVANFLPVLEPLLLRSRVVMVEDSVLVTTSATPVATTSPQTNCAGYGFSCCDPVQSLGVGEQRPSNDCSQDCYASCQHRPIVLSFNGEPGFDRYQRVLQANTVNDVIFNFVIDSLLPELSSATLDFGDGTSWTGLATDTAATHQYQCEQAECSYLAKLTVVDAYGTQSAPTAATQIQVIIRP